MHQAVRPRERAIQCITVALSIAQLAALLLFLRFVRAADLVTDKAGAGNLEIWKHYNNSAEDALLWLLLSWIASLAFAYILVHAWRKNLFIWFGIIMPLAGAFVYAAFLALVAVH